MRVKKGLVVKQLGEKWIVYDVHQAILHELNELGGELVNMISKKEKTIDALKDWLRERYEVEEKQLDQDMEKFIDKLGRAGILEEQKEFRMKRLGRKKGQKK